MQAKTKIPPVLFLTVLAVLTGMVEAEARPRQPVNVVFSNDCASLSGSNSEWFSQSEWLLQRLGSGKATAIEPQPLAAFSDSALAVNLFAHGLSNADKSPVGNDRSLAAWNGFLPHAMAAVLSVLIVLVYGIVRLRREIGRHQRCETDLTLLYNTMSLGFVLHEAIRDGEGRIIDYRYLELNPAFERMTGIRRNDWLGKTASSVASGSQRSWLDHFAEVEHSQTAKRFETCAHGLDLWFMTDCYQADSDRFVVLLQDVSSNKKAEENLRLLARVFSDAHEGIIITDVDAKIIDVNAAFAQITGYDRNEAIGRNPSMLKSGRHDAEFYAQMWHALNEQGHWQGEIWNRKKSGELYAELLTISALRDSSDKAAHYVGLFSDITESKEQQQALEILAHYDALTQLPNRTLFADRFRQAISHCKRTESLLALCYLDLDGFKQVNDTYGHQVGDDLLVEVAERIKANLRECDTVCRLGGDEFALLFENLQSPQQCEDALKRIHTALAEPFLLDDHRIRIAASSGVTLYPLDNEDPDILLRHADQTMYQAKLAGRNCYRIYQPLLEHQRLSQHAGFGRLQQALADIRDAMAQSQFCLYYQPKINSRTGKVVGAEALIRWQHPERGLLGPSEFMPIIESTPLEIDISIWVIRQTFQQLQAWMEKGLVLQVGVNVSPRFLQWQNFLVTLDSMLSEYPAVSSKQLELEVLESSVLDDLIAVGEILKQCHYQLGVPSALDDFGTGYSSLTHLRHLTINTVKIDQGFVRNMIDDPDDQAIVESVIGLAKAFKRNVIAEGVEQIDHGVVLSVLGCELLQGNAVARAMPGDDLFEWAMRFKNPPAWQRVSELTLSQQQKQLLLLGIQQRYWLKLLQEAVKHTTDAPPRWPVMNPKRSHLGQWLLRVQAGDGFDPALLQRISQYQDQQTLLIERLRQQHPSGNQAMMDELMAQISAISLSIEQALKQMGAIPEK
ncbi:MAG: EAL domain-containing protein [Methylomonas sp.]|nr:EAL domain-containing protein [Methylomonas sp.]PPD22796.1 MAG: hypothetical protein CTY23_00245 [Methylomonas sp.]PPD25285.1 MAG: hypothetical protein CTY22_09240 [Methylomonas sp.]PPD35274.1 MAG: hypothetical protein CTY21_09240 [Methylomonas sp.]PPD42766.1 MAG: hypothetical protein CTY17_00220 [Methylomonas sp.]